MGRNAVGTSKLRRTLGRATLATAGALFTLLAARPARAQDDAAVQRARALFTEATEDEAAQRWPSALAKLRQVDAVKDTAGVRFHLANCEEHVGQIAEARVDFIRANELAKAEGATDVGQLAPDRISDLEGRVPRLTLDVPAELRASARITLDGAVVDPSTYGVQTFVDPGVHQLAATAPGRASLSQSIEMSERHAVVFTVKLPPEGAPPPASTASTPAAATTSAPPAATEPSAPASATASAPAGPSRTGAVLTAVGAGVLVIGGVLAFVEAGSVHSTNLAQCATMTTSCDDLRTPVRAWDAVALGAWIGGAALATVSILLFVSRSPASPASVALRVGPGQVGLGGHF